MRKLDDSKRIPLSPGRIAFEGYPDDLKSCVPNMNSCMHVDLLSKTHVRLDCIGNFSGQGIKQYEKH